VSAGILIPPHCRRARRRRDKCRRGSRLHVSQLIGGVDGALLLRSVLGGAATGLGMPALAHDLALGVTTSQSALGRLVIERARLFPGHGRAQHSGRRPRRQISRRWRSAVTLTLNIIMAEALPGRRVQPARALADGRTGNSTMPGCI